MGRVQTTISALTTDERTCPSDNLSPGGSVIGIASGPFGSTCPQPLTLFAQPEAAELTDAHIISFVPQLTEEEIGAIFAQIDPEPPVLEPEVIDEPVVVSTPVTNVATSGQDASSTSQTPASTEPPVAAPIAPATVLDSVPTVTAIGDSVMLGAAYTLASNIPGIDLDAAVGRQASAAIGLLQQKAAAGLLGEVVVVHIGNNGTLTSDQFDQLMAVIGPERKVIVLNLHVPRAWEEGNNAVIASGVTRYANAVFIDWSAAGNTYPELLYNDSIHLTPSGAAYYSQLVIAAIGG
jgi:hypothetical protein